MTEPRRASARKPKETPMTDAPAPVRKFAKQVDTEISDGPVVMKTVRVLPMGADKISTGRHEAQFGDEFYAKGEKFECEESVALALERRGFVEVE